MSGVAQPGLRTCLGAGGPRFKSARPDQLLLFQRSCLSILRRTCLRAADRHDLR